MALEHPLLQDLVAVIQSTGIRVIENENDSTYRVYKNEFKTGKYSYICESYYVSYLVNVNDLIRTLGIDELSWADNGG